MGSILKDRAVVLRTWEYGETSLVVSMLTRSGGRSNFLAKGAKRSKSPMHGRFRTGNIGDVVYYDKPAGGLKLVKEFSAGPVLDSSKADFERLCLFQAGLEIAARQSTGDELEGSVYDLLEGFIGALAAGADPWAAFFVLEISLLGAAGLMPAIERCDGCKKDLAACGFTINPSSGAVECAECSGEDVRMSDSSCRMMAMMSEKKFAEIGSLRIGEVERKEIGTLLHRILTHHMDGYRLPGSLGMLKGAG